MRAIYATGDSQDCRRFSGSRRTVEEEMRQPVLLDELLDWSVAQGWWRD